MFYNWKPANWASANALHDFGGPLVDVDTGQVIVLANLSPELWTKLAGIELPPGAWAHPRPPEGWVEPAPLDPESFMTAARGAWMGVAA